MNDYLSYKEIKNNSADKLKNTLLEYKNEILKLRFQKTSMELKDTSKFRKLRKTMARLYTAINVEKREE